MQRGHDDPAVEPLVAAVAEDEAQDPRPARRDCRKPKELLLQWGKYIGRKSRQVTVVGPWLGSLRL